MAEEQDQSQKTEQPTEKRLQDAREKGQVASSREVNNFMLMAVATLVAGTVAGPSASHISASLERFLGQAHLLPTDGSGLGDVVVSALLDTAFAMALPLAGFVVAAIAATALQGNLMWTAHSLQPKAERISPISGLKRLFSPKSLFEFVKNLVKISLVGAIGLAVLWPERERLIGAGQLPIEGLIAYMGRITLWLMAAVTALLALLAGIDYAYQRFEFMKQMRMSRRDIKDEHKQSDGDPQIKQRLRNLRMQRSRQRMMAEVPNATVVITNPTHVAVALHYEMGESSAPKVVAKGVDHVALKIREVARAHDVPTVESPPLARALNETVEIGDFIPAEHYRAVAEIIGHILRLGQRP